MKKKRCEEILGEKKDCVKLGRETQNKMHELQKGKTQDVERRRRKK